MGYSQHVVRCEELNWVLLKNPRSFLFAGPPSKYLWSFLGDGVGAEDLRGGDAEPGRRERICKQLFSSQRLMYAGVSAGSLPDFVWF